MVNAQAILQAKRELDAARRIGSELKIALAEAALNALLDETHVTGNRT